MQSEREQARAAQIIYEIVKRSTADTVHGKTRLFKAFYFAHLFYLDRTGGYLSGWRIVRMPNGPGIDCFPLLMNALQELQLIQIRQSYVGPFRSYDYQLTDADPPPEWGDFDTEETEAIRAAVDFVADKSGAQLSDITHEFSRSWLAAEDGEVLNIYEDLVDEEVYQRETQRAKELERELDEIWN